MACPCFFVPVGMELLRQYSDRIAMEKMEPPGFADPLGLVVSMTQMCVHLKKDFDKDYVRDLVVQAGLDPESIIYTPGTDVLYGGKICQLKGRNGYWCPASYCRGCSHKMDGPQRFQCSAPNCANNVRFRRKFICDD